MVDLKEIPGELSTLLKAYSRLSSLINNISAALDLRSVDSFLIDSLENYCYIHTYTLIETKYKSDVLRRDIETYLRDNLQIKFTQMYLWDGKIMYE